MSNASLKWCTTFLSVHNWIVKKCNVCTMTFISIAVLYQIECFCFSPLLHFHLMRHYVKICKASLCIVHFVCISFAPAEMYSNLAKCKFFFVCRTQQELFFKTHEQRIDSHFCSLPPRHSTERFLTLKWSELAKSLMLTWPLCDSLDEKIKCEFAYMYKYNMYI